MLVIDLSILPYKRVVSNSKCQRRPAGLDRFPPPAVVVLAEDLFAVSRHTGRAMI